MGDTDRRRRAEARRGVAVLTRTRLKATEHDLSPIAGASAVSLVHALTREGWSEGGRAFPSYSRAEIPIRFVRGRLT